MEKTELFNHKINDVSTTLLITLYCRALESQSRDPILNDPKAVEITRQLNPELAKSDNKFYQNLAKGKLDQWCTLLYGPNGMIAMLKIS
jgi:O-methyltransferase involved in polyketide biosynthesis